MLGKMKKNWLMKLLIILFLAFIVFEVFSNSGLNKTSVSNKSDIKSETASTITPDAPISNGNDNQKPTGVTIDEYGDEASNTSQSYVVQYDIEEYVPYKNADFEIISLNDNKLVVKTNVDKNKAEQSLTDFLKKEVTQDSQTFEVVWQ